MSFCGRRAVQSRRPAPTRSGSFVSIAWLRAAVITTSKWRTRSMAELPGRCGSRARASTWVRSRSSGVHSRPDGPALHRRSRSRLTTFRIRGDGNGNRTETRRALSDAGRLWTCSRAAAEGRRHPMEARGDRHHELPVARSELSHPRGAAREAAAAGIRSARGSGADGLPLVLRQALLAGGPRLWDRDRGLSGYVQRTQRGHRGYVLPGALGGYSRCHPDRPRGARLSEALRRHSTALLGP